MNGTLTPGDRLKYWTEYQNQLHRETQEQLAEMTRYTNLKIVLLGALLVFSKGRIALFVFLFVPIAMYTLDLIHSLRFNHIFDRWQYLSTVAAPEIRLLLGSAVGTFADGVMSRATTGIYREPNMLMRSLILTPALVIAAVACGTLAVTQLNLHERVGHYVSGATYVISAIGVFPGRRYRLSWLVVGGVILAVTLTADDRWFQGCIYATLDRFLAEQSGQKL